MKRFGWLLFAVLLALPAHAQWALYPAARRDQALEKSLEDRAKALGVPATKGTQTIALTSDSFEKVLAFYAPRGKEELLPLLPGQPSSGYERELPSEIKRTDRRGGMAFIGSGVKAKHVFIILDGAADVGDSKDFITITRPFIFDATREAGKMVYRDIREVTVITRFQE